MIQWLRLRRAKRPEPTYVNQPNQNWNLSWVCLGLSKAWVYFETILILGMLLLIYLGLRYLNLIQLLNLSFNKSILYSVYILYTLFFC